MDCSARETHAARTMTPAPRECILCQLGDCASLCIDESASLGLSAAALRAGARTQSLL